MRQPAGDGDSEQKSCPQICPPERARWAAIYTWKRFERSNEINHVRRYSILFGPNLSKSGPEQGLFKWK
jgi:hypothetical protein